MARWRRSRYSPARPASPPARQAPRRRSAGGYSRARRAGAAGRICSCSWRGAPSTEQASLGNATALDVMPIPASAMPIVHGVEAVQARGAAPSLRQSRRRPMAAPHVVGSAASSADRPAAARPSPRAPTSCGRRPASSCSREGGDAAIASSTSRLRARGRPTTSTATATGMARWPLDRRARHHERRCDA